MVSVQWHVIVQHEPDRMVDGIVLTVVVVICIYQWTFVVPVAWRIWVRRSRL